MEKANVLCHLDVLMGTFVAANMSYSDRVIIEYDEFPQRQ